MVDFRKGHDGLAALVKNELRKDPFTGTVFVFRSKRADRLKWQYWDGTGLVPLGRLLCNRLPGNAWLTKDWRNTPSLGLPSGMA